MASGKLNISVEQGAIFEMIVTISDQNQAAIDLTGFDFRGQIRSSVSGTGAPAASFSFEIYPQTVLATKGKVRVYIPSAATSLIAAPVSKGTKREVGKYVYDIEYGPLSGERFRLLQGDATVSPEVTK